MDADGRSSGAVRGTTPAHVSNPAGSAGVSGVGGYFRAPAGIGLTAMGGKSHECLMDSSTFSSRAGTNPSRCYSACSALQTSDPDPVMATGLGGSESS